MRSGSLRQRGPGAWQYRASYGARPDGRQQVRSATIHATTQSAAEKQARKIRADWDRDDKDRAAYKGTVRDLVEKWQALTEHSPTTRERERSIVDAIVAEFGTVRTTELTAYDLDRWYQQLARPYPRTYMSGGKPRTRQVVRSANTIRHYHRVLAAILQQGFKWDMVDRNVALKAKPPRRTETDQAHHMPTMAALEVMLGMASRSVRMAVLLGATTGCRRGEIVGLRWSDLHDGTLIVSRSAYHVAGDAGVKAPKNAKAKVIALNPSMLAELARFRTEALELAESAGVKLAADGPILANLRDPTGRTGYTPRWLSQEWERLCARAGVPDFHLHGLRHLHGSMLTGAGVSLAAAAKRQGHGVQVMAERYLHAIDADDLAAVDTVERIFAPLFLTSGA